MTKALSVLVLLLLATACGENPVGDLPRDPVGADSVEVKDREPWMQPRNPM